MPPPSKSEFRVLVTGSRDWTDRDAIRADLDDLYALHGTALTVVHGGCRTGADAIAHEWLTERGVTPDVHHADFRTKGRKEGPIRNRRMVAKGADLCLAYRLGGTTSRGTTDCMEVAERAGIETRVREA